MSHIFLSSLLIIISTIFFIINDGIINYLSPQDVQFYHFIFYGTPAYLAVPLYLFIKGKLKNHLRATNYFIPFLRACLLLPMPLVTFLSLKNISLPEFTTLNMSSPIMAVFYAFFLLKEKINIFVIFSLTLGTIGVLFVIQPGFNAYNPYFLLVLFGAFIVTGSTVIVNKYNEVASFIGYYIYGGILIHILSFILFIIDPLYINFKTFLLISIASISINSAMLLTTWAFQRSQKYYSSIFCLVYLQILWSMLVGYFVFNEYLNVYAIFGAFLIIISGILSVRGQYKQVN